MSDRLTTIELYKGEELPIQVDFRPKCKRIGSNIATDAHTAKTSGIISIGTSSISSNIVSVVITALTKGCTILQTTGTTSEGYDLIGLCEIHVLDQTECD